MDRARLEARRLLAALGSLKLTLLCLFGLMVVVTACTLAQPGLGIFGAVKLYIRSLFVWWTPAGAALSIPIFPGGGFWGVLLLLNLVAAHFLRLELSWRKAGLWVVHAGLIILFGGEFVTGMFQRESRMVLEQGKPTSHIESSHELELAVVDASPADHDRVVRVPERRLSGRLDDARLPFALAVERYDDGSAGGILESRMERARLRLTLPDSPGETA